MKRALALFAVLLLLAPAAWAGRQPAQQYIMNASGTDVAVGPLHPMPVSLVGGGISVGTMTLAIPVSGPTGFATDPVIITFASNTVTLAESSKVVTLGTNTVTLAPGATVSVASQGVVVMGQPNVTATWATNTVSLNQTVTAIDGRGRVSSPASYTLTITAGTTKTLQQVGSWTVPCSLRMQVDNVAFVDGQRLAQWEVLAVLPSTNLYNVNILASSSSNVVVNLLVSPLVP